MRIVKRGLQTWGKKRLVGHKTMHSLCKNFLIGYYNSDTNPETNGEFNFLDRLSWTEDLEVFFDVGAHSGAWSQRVLDTFPAATVHAFEISPPNFLLLEKIQDPRLKLNDFGLSNETGQVDVYHYPGSPVNTSVHYNPRLERRLQTVSAAQARVETGDKYCKDMQLQTVDFIKVDAEGHDLFVIKGFKDLIERKAVRFIQFEYNRSAISARVYLQDFIDFFGQSYKIHRILPDRLVEDEFDMFSENFVQSNFVAVRVGE